jgi:penicillin-binding protein 1C
VPGLVGREAAAPILFDAFARMGAPLAALPRPPVGVLVTSSAKLPPLLKRFQAAPGAAANAQASLHVLFPPDGARLDLSTTDGKRDPIALKITGAVAPITLLVNGVPVQSQKGGTLLFAPDGPGFVRVTVINATGSTDSVLVRIDDGTSASLSLRAAQ